MFRRHTATQAIAPVSADARLRPRRRRPLRWRVMLAICGFLLIGSGLLGLLAHEDPTFVPEAVDLARAVFGPGVVGQVESLVYQAQDSWRHANYTATGATNHTQWAAPVPTPAAAAPASAPAAPLVQQPTASALPTAPAATADSAGAADSDNAAAVMPADWSPFIYTSSGQAVMERALIAPDPTRPYVEAALVRIDLHLAQLHLVAGTQEPASGVRAARPGMIPLADQRSGRLLAAFNGGFKAANGAFGMAVNGTALLPPTNGLATLAIYRDGHVRLGVWGSDMSATPDMIAYRQNCPLLLDGGKLTDLASSDDPTLWGKTVKNKIAVWRSGLGISADGRYLIYAAGDGLTVPTLAQALSEGGADRAMQLDINSWWARFVTYSYTSGSASHPIAQKLLNDMVGNLRQFLEPDTRDFFYLTAR